MIINHEYKFVFIHVPKAGGCSIRGVLEGYTERNQFHKTIRDIPEECKEYFKFGFVRNPWDRMVSLYHFLMNNNWGNTAIEHRELRRIGFKKALLSGLLDDPVCEVDAQNDAMFWLEGCDFIGRTEKMQEDLRTVTQIIGHPDVTVSCLNRGEHRPYQEYYDAVSEGLVRERHRETIERFGYAFD